MSARNPSSHDALIRDLTDDLAPVQPLPAPAWRALVWLAAVAVIGIAGALGLGRAAQSLLFQLEGHDPLVIVLSAVTLAFVAFSAGLIPALRASRIDPMQALRYE